MSETARPESGPLIGGESGRLRFPLRGLFLEAQEEALVSSTACGAQPAGRGGGPKEQLPRPCSRLWSLCLLFRVKEMKTLGHVHQASHDLCWKKQTNPEDSNCTQMGNNS